MASSTSSSIEARSQTFQTRFEDICREIQGSIQPNIVVPWTNDDDTATDSGILGPYLEGGMPERLVVHLKDNLVDLSALDKGTTKTGMSFGRSHNGRPRLQTGRNGCRGWNTSSANSGKIKVSTT
ncbi:hypothetical protein Pyn_25011 [Prunus yedoensis var. nudiflora]|uniref:Uncharacterized protein n=1 Tax=Prunus yedoensis var. nudiflora TaxID=2094558 RepID=A0A314XV92_PRUYE|nr:hypothetical protein Pyn_25011 [Prunus yedoensis var. nudiflora]